MQTLVKKERSSGLASSVPPFPSRQESKKFMKITPVVVIASLVLAGCAQNPLTRNQADTRTPSAQAAPAATTSSTKREVKGINDWSGYIQGTPAPNSRFANLRIGMGQKEAMDIAGAPTDQGAHVTGKAFIPFYMGSGAVETWLHYKGVGRLLFASNGGFSTNTGLIGIEHDASERGYR